MTDSIPVGILYRNDDVPCYEDVINSPELITPEIARARIESELDKFTVWPASEPATASLE